jgi:nucleotide-binding universal stress UspA family protein
VNVTETLLLVALGWVLFGSVLAFAMARRGHAAFGWWVVGVVLGPLAIPSALATIRREEPGAPRVVESGRSAEGPVDVVVGIDGSPGSEAAASAVAELFGPRLGRLTLATVLDFEAATSTRTWQSEDQARAALADLSARVADIEPGSVLLSGSPADALGRLCAEEGYDLVAVGARGRGASKLLLGSVATRLAKGSGVPVLIVRA